MATTSDAGVFLRIDGGEACSLQEFLSDNEDFVFLAEEEVHLMRTMRVGESITLGGGAFATFTVERVAEVG